METLEPSSFDALLISSGLPEALIASALAKAGKSVLIIDPAEHYGSSWASHAGSSFPAWQQTQQTSPVAAPATAREPVQPAECISDFTRVQISQPAESTSQSSAYVAAGFRLDKEYIVDLCPKALYQAEALVDILIKTKAYNYLEFKLVEGSYLMRADGHLARVPASKSDIFRDRSLGVSDKRLLMRFLTGCLEAEQGGGRLQDAFDDSPLVELLQREGLSSELQDVVLHGIAMCDMPQRQQQQQQQQQENQSAQAQQSSQATQQQHQHQQPQHQQQQQAGPNSPPDEPVSTSERGAAAHSPAPAAATYDLMSAKQGLAALQLYMRSLGRFGGQGALMVPTYGSGSLPEAFVRHAAVNGAVTVLRYGVDSLLLQGGRCVGLVLASGQVLRCEALVGDAQSLACLLQGDGASGSSDGAVSAAGGRQNVAHSSSNSSSTSSSTSSSSGRASDGVGGSGSKANTSNAVARAVCVLDGPVADQDSSSALLVAPPSVPLACGCVVRGLQLGPGACVAPQGRYLLHLAAQCSHVGGADPEAVLRPALEALVCTQGLQPVRSGAQAGIAVGCGVVENGVELGSGNAAESSGRPDVRPKALAVVYYRQQHSTSSEACSTLPSNVACCRCADGGLVGYEAAVAAAEAVFRITFPGMAWLADEAEAQEDGAAAVLDEGEEDSMAELLSALEVLAPLPNAVAADDGTAGAVPAAGGEAGTRMLQ